MGWAREGEGGCGHSDVNSKSAHAKIIGRYSMFDHFCVGEARSTTAIFLLGS